MSILDKVIGAVTGKGGDMGGLTKMLGIKLDDQSSLSGLVNSIMGGQGTGGLSGLVQQLTQGGLGEQVKSWVGTGANQAVTPEALNGALGQDKIAAFAQSMGISPEQASAALAKVLPQAVDKMTPNGRIETV